MAGKSIMLHLCFLLSGQNSTQLNQSVWYWTANQNADNKLRKLNGRLGFASIFYGFFRGSYAFERSLLDADCYEQYRNWKKTIGFLKWQQ